MNYRKKLSKQSLEMFDCKDLKELLTFRQGISNKPVNLQWADLQGANLQEANLQRARLQYANLQRANLLWANLQYANLRHSNLQYADLIGANLHYTKLQYANLQGAAMDYSCITLSCGTLYTKFDEKHIIQLLYHAAKPCEIMQRQDKDLKDLVNSDLFKKVANKFHRVNECGEI
jgi:uncharacterized protein YjbI with pentapeptide repeats